VPTRRWQPPREIVPSRPLHWPPLELQLSHLEAGIPSRLQALPDSRDRCHLSAVPGACNFREVRGSPDGHFRRTGQWPETTGTGTDDRYQRVPNRRSRISDRVPNAAPERRPSLSWVQHISAPTRALASCKHARRWAAWATPRTDRGQGEFCLLGLRNRSGRPLYDSLHHHIIDDAKIDTIADQVRSDCIATAVLAHNPCRLMSCQCKAFGSFQ
jgi:hypothetical protein